MSKRSKSSADRGSAPATSLSPGVRRGLSLFFVFHLVAITACPLAVTPSSWLFQRRLFPLVSWYANALFLNHGYRFFAPNPGPSFLLRWEVTTDDGRTLEETIPDLQQQWPRLFYHRHFMLTSRLQGGPQDPMVQSYAHSYARHLYEKYDAEQVKLFLKVHALAEPGQVRSGMQLDDPRLYEEELLYTYPPAEAQGAATEELP